MALGRNQTYLTAVVLGCVLVCAAVLALRWHALAQREGGSDTLKPYRRGGLSGTAASTGHVSAAEPNTAQPAAANRGEEAAAQSDPGLNASQLRRLAASESNPGATGAAGSAADEGHSEHGNAETAAGKAGGKAASAVSFPLELNRANAAQLEAVPGIGPVLAQRILDYRRQHGAYHSLDELDSVKGIGPKTLEQLREYLYIGQGKGH